MTDPTDSASKRLTVHNASVTTMTVEVKTLTIGARQVTQGIFKQLIEEPLIAEDGTLNGVPWGHVTWHPERCDDAKTAHRHLVWQKGDELRRSWIDEKPPFDREPSRHAFRTAATDAYLTALVREACHGRAPQPLDSDDNTFANLDNPYGVPAWGTSSAAARKAASLGFRIRKLIEDIECPIGEYSMNFYRLSEWKRTHPRLASLIEEAVKAGVTISTSVGREVRIQAPEGHGQAATLLRKQESELQSFFDVRHEEERTQLQQVRKLFAQAVASLDAEQEARGRDWLTIRDAFSAEVQAEAARRQRHRDVRAQLAALPQLFIGG